MVGVLLDTDDTTDGDERVVFIARDAIVAHQGLTRGSDVDTAPERAAENAALRRARHPRARRSLNPCHHRRCLQRRRLHAVELTAAVNVVPNTYGRLQELDLMPGEGVPTTSVAVAVRQRRAESPADPDPRGSAVTGYDGRTQRALLRDPAHPARRLRTGQDVQNVVSLGGNVLENVQDVVNRKLATMRRKHAITLEFLRMGALSGQILDADGS